MHLLELCQNPFINCIQNAIKYFFDGTKSGFYIFYIKIYKFS